KRAYCLKIQPATGSFARNLIYSTKPPDDHRLMVWSGQSLYAWHVNRLIAPNERTTDEQKKRVGYFVFHNDQWWLVNEGLSGLILLPDRKKVGIGEKLLLEDNTQFILSSEDGGRLVVVQLLNN
ncbi:hypothetical protein RAH05_25320, partial [Klebsiella pneumoniae]